MRDLIDKETGSKSDKPPIPKVKDSNDDAWRGFKNPLVWVVLPFAWLGHKLFMPGGWFRD